MTYQWVDRDRDFVAQRYDRIAGLITFFDWLLFVPAKFRRRAAEMTAVRAGAHVLEIGCGTGRNLQFLSEAVGRNGRVYGVDLSQGMLDKARAMCADRGLTNVTLIHADALEYRAPRSSTACCSDCLTTRCRTTVPCCARRSHSCALADAL